jgi:hypothetical protein
MFLLNTILAWNINIIMNKKYNNNNIIIASRAYFLQIAPELFVQIPKCTRKCRTMREALIERHWIADMQGATCSLTLLPIRVGLDTPPRCAAATGFLTHCCVAVDGVRAILFQVLLRAPFSRDHHIKFLEA